MWTAHKRKHNTFNSKEKMAGHKQRQHTSYSEDPVLDLFISINITISLCSTCVKITRHENKSCQRAKLVTWNTSKRLCKRYATFELCQEKKKRFHTYISTEEETKRKRSSHSTRGQRWTSIGRSCDLLAKHSVRIFLFMFVDANVASWLSRLAHYLL